MRKQSFLVAAVLATSCQSLQMNVVQAQQTQIRRPQQSQVGDPARQPKISQLRNEAEQAEREYQTRQAEVRRLEPYEKVAGFMKRGADAAVEGGRKIASDPATKAQAIGIELVYKGVTKSILDPQRAERRNKLMEESRAKTEEARLRKQQWEQDVLRRQEEFNRRLRVPNFTER